MPGRLPGGGGIPVEFCRVSQLCEKEQMEKQAAQGPHVENLIDVRPKHREKDNPTDLSSRPRAPVAGRSLG